MLIRDGVHSGWHPFGIASIRDSAIRDGAVRDGVHSGWCPFRIVSIRDGVNLGWYPFRMVSIRDGVHLGWNPFEIVSIRDVVFRDHVQDLLSNCGNFLFEGEFGAVVMPFR